MLPQRRRAHDAQRQPHFQRVKPARRLNTFVDQVWRPFLLGAERIEVIGMVRHMAEVLFIAHEKRPAADGLEE